MVKGKRLTPQLVSLLIVLLVLLILFGIGFGGYKIYKSFIVQPSVEKPTFELKKGESLNQIKNTAQHGTPISPTEGGYGRADPFAPY